MSATLLQVADAVVTELNNHDGFTGVDYTALRLYRPSYSKEQLATLRVSVVPKDEDIKRLSRSHIQTECKIDVGVQQRVKSTSDTEALDRLTTFVEDIVKLFDQKPLSYMANAYSVLPKPLPIYDPDTLEDEQVFLSVATLTVKVL
jgi:hypothetical protein